jgi:cysteine-rich repeat protein
MDGAWRGGRACDDGNVVSGDGCSAAGVIEATYYCHPGKIGAIDTCVESCGNGVNLFAAGSGRCDDGDNIPYDGCDSNCKVETGYTCTAASPSVCTEKCGDGIDLKTFCNHFDISLLLI